MVLQLIVSTNFAATGATSGIGILKRTGTGVLKAEITALETMGLGKTISNPKVFTLDNQSATVTQGKKFRIKLHLKEQLQLLLKRQH